MEYRVGQKLQWLPKLRHQPQEVVEVVAIRSRGKAMLSNGWVVDEDGRADGTDSRPGGVVVALDAPE